MCVCVCVSCNLQITLHPCIRSTEHDRAAKLPFPVSDFVSVTPLFLFLHSNSSHFPLLSGPSHVIYHNSPRYPSYSEAHFSVANCYLWTFVCSRPSLLTIHLIGIICYLAFGADALQRGGSEVRILIWRLRNVLTGPIHNKIILESPVD